MAKSRNKKGKASKPSVKVGDLKPEQNPKGGRFSKVEVEYIPTKPALNKIQVDYTGVAIKK